MFLAMFMRSLLITENNWDQGEGLQRALRTAKHRQLIRIERGHYYVPQGQRFELRSPVRIMGEGHTLKGSATSYGSADIDWPRFYNDNAREDYSGILFELADGVGGCQFHRLSVDGFEAVFYATGENSLIKISDIKGTHLRQLIRVNVARRWRVQRLIVRGVAKRVFHAQQAFDSLVKGVNADCMDRNGVTHSDWPMLIWLGERSQDVKIRDCVLKNPVQRTGSIYDNGDGIVIEAGSQDIRVSDVVVFYPGDSGIDTKAHSTTVRRMKVFGAGNRSFRAHEAGVLKLYDCGSYELGSVDAVGSNADIWTGDAQVIAKNFEVDSPFVGDIHGDGHIQVTCCRV